MGVSTGSHINDIESHYPLKVQSKCLGAIHMSWDDPQARFVVVVNHEEQYSIWPDHRDLPAGWRDVGFRGVREECLAHVEQVWTDMRPLSLRRALEADPA
jgi:MbtH protein